MRQVTDTDGREVVVVTEADLLALERSLRRWVIGTWVTFLAGAYFVGSSYASTVKQVEANRARIEEVRTEGSIPLQQLRTDIALIKEQQRANSEMIRAIAVKLRVNTP